MTVICAIILALWALDSFCVFYFWDLFNVGLWIWWIWFLILIFRFFFFWWFRLVEPFILGSIVLIFFYKNQELLLNFKVHTWFWCTTVDFLFLLFWKLVMIIEYRTSTSFQSLCMQLITLTVSICFWDSNALFVNSQIYRVSYSW